MLHILLNRIQYFSIFLCVNMFKYVFMVIFYWQSCFSEQLANFPEACINFNVHVNGKHVSDDFVPNNTLYYDIHDKITFSCSVGNTSACNIMDTYNIKVVFMRNGSNITVPEMDSIHFISYTITADDFDNAAEVYCRVGLWSSTKTNNLPKQTASKRLIMNSGKHFITIYPEVRYNERDVRKYTCNSQDNNTLTFINERRIINDTIYTIQIRSQEIELTSSGSGSTLYCEIIKNRGITNESIINGTLNYTREIYNKTLYLYNPREINKSFSVQIAIGAVVVICVIVVSILLLLYKNKKKRPAEDTSTNQDTVLYDCPDQVIYADLELYKRPAIAPVSPGSDDSTSNYVQIVGFLSKNI